MLTKTRLRKLLEDGDVSQAEVSSFYRSARAFFLKAMEYSLANLPISDALLKNAAFVNFSERESTDFSQVEYFVER